MKERVITGVTDCWMTGTSKFDIDRLKNSERVSDFGFSEYDMSDCGWMKVGTAEFKITLTCDDAEIVKSQVDVLRNEIKKTREHSARKVNELECQIQNLLAITCDIEEK